MDLSTPPLTTPLAAPPTASLATPLTTTSPAASPHPASDVQASIRASLQAYFDDLGGEAPSTVYDMVLRLVERTVAGARRHGRWVGVCGGLAGEPLGAALLVGLGVDELSMSTGDIGTV